LAIAELGLQQFHQNLIEIIAFLWLFFCGFNLLEATLPSLVSKTAPADLKGTAMGAYSSSQFMGLFLGGGLGGWFNGQYGESAVFIFCACAALSWLVVAFAMRPPRYWSNLLISLDNLAKQDAQPFLDELMGVAGVQEVRPHFEEAVAYLKVDNQQLDSSRLQQLIAQYTHSPN